MRRYIHVTKETREFLSKSFDIEPRTVYNALNFVKDNDLAKRVRKLAYEKGGILMCQGEWGETLHDHDNYMRQYLPNGVLWSLTRTTAVAMYSIEVYVCAITIICCGRILRMFKLTD